MSLLNFFKRHPTTLKLHPGSKLPVEVVDRFTARWLASLPNKATVFSPVGVWPLLAILADVASPEVRAELEAALCVPNDNHLKAKARDNRKASRKPTKSALAVLHLLDTSPGMSAALGLWVSSLLDLREEWVLAIPSATVQVLTGHPGRDSAALKAWAMAQTLGLIPSLDVHVEADTILYLASAVTMSTRWVKLFGRTHDGRLYRKTKDPSIVCVSEDITTVCIQGCKETKRGEHGVHDLYLVLGRPDDPAGEVLALGLAAIRSHGHAQALTAKTALAETELGPGVHSFSVLDDEVGDEGPFVCVKVPSFEITARTAIGGEVFGLSRASREGENFPGMAVNVPFAISGGMQMARAQFDETGFEAAAFTELEVNAFSAMVTPRPPRKQYYINVEIDRAFGFLAVHRDSGLLVFAGWVTEDEWTRASSHLHGGS